MKKIKIWINSLTLVQQFICVAFLTIAFFALFFFSFVGNGIDKFVDDQMYAKIHESQSEFIAFNYSDLLNDADEVKHYIFSTRFNKYLDIIQEEDIEIVEAINILGPARDGYVENGDIIVNYSIKDIGPEKLVSIINPNTRVQYKTRLMESVFNVSMRFAFGLFLFFLIWVVSLIRPLNQIKTYIYKKRNGETSDLKIARHDEIGEVADAIVTLNEELEKQNRIKEEMIQNISHDLKTPIATIKSYSESIKDGVYPYDTLEKSVDVIIEHADRLEKKVYSLLTLNKIGYLQDVDESKQVLMADVISKAILSCEVLRNDIEIETSLNEEVYFHGEEEPWRVVVENLLDNSLRYAKTKVTISLDNNLLEVFNDGEAIEKDRLSKLFKPYEKGTKGKFGLGLSIVKRVSETYGYQVTGENAENGVVFRIWRIATPKKQKGTSKKT